MLKGEWLMFLTLALSMLPSLAGVPGLLPTSLWFLELKIQFQTLFLELEIELNLKLLFLELKFKACVAVSKSSNCIEMPKV